MIEGFVGTFQKRLAPVSANSEIKHAGDVRIETGTHHSLREARDSQDS